MALRFHPDALSGVARNEAQRRKRRSIGYGLIGILLDIHPFEKT